MKVISKEDVAMVQNRCGRLLHNRLTDVAISLGKKYECFKLCGAVRPQVIESARKAYVDTSAEKIIAIDAFFEGGKHGIVLTEDALYTSDISRIPFAGLKDFFYDTERLELVLNYSDGSHIRKFQYQAEEVVDILAAVLKVYEDLTEKIKAGREIFSLNFVEGWRDFVDSKNRQRLGSGGTSVFVSSTFKDMHYERDIIHEKVLPALNEKAAVYGQNLTFCDLRWGVNTSEMESEEGAKKVLSVCLNEIERCQPYMIVILGQRYGWIPEEALVEETVKKWFDEDLDGLHQSVTALEIEFGALMRDARLNRTLFYFREIEGSPSQIYLSEDSFHMKKLDELKQRIKKIAPGRVKNYTLHWNKEKEEPEGLDSFAQMVTEDIQQLLEQEWEKSAKLSVYERENQIHWNFAAQKAMQCTARDGVLGEILEKLETDIPLIILKGKPGSGKSTLLGMLAEVLRLSRTETCLIFCGHTGISNTVEDIMWHQICFFEEQLASKHGGAQSGERNLSREELQQKLNQMACQYEQVGEKKLILLVDAPDQLPAEDFRNQLKFLPDNLSGKIAAVVSCTEEFPTEAYASIMQVPLFTSEECVQVVRANLESIHRELDDRVIDKIAAKESAGQPLYVKLLIQRLLMMDKSDFDKVTDRGDGIEAITAYQTELIEEAPEELYAANAWLLDAAVRKLHNPMAETAVQFMAVSRRGLRESDLEGMISERGILWNALDFSLFINFLAGIFQRREDGTIDFVHKSTREGILMGLPQREMHRQISEWMWSLPEWDAIRKSEWVYHCCCAEDGEKLAIFAETVQKDEEKLRHAAGNLLAACRVVGYKWLIRFIESGNKAMGHGFFQIIQKLNWHNNRSEKEESMLEQIYKVSLTQLEKMVCEDASLDADIAIISARLSNIFWMRDGEENEKQAVLCMKKSYEVACRRYEKEKTPESLFEMTEFCRMLGVFHRTMQDKGNPDKTHQERAFRYLTESLENFENLANRYDEVKYRKQIARVNYDLGLYYDRFDMEEDAERYFLRSLKLYENLLQETKNLQIAKNSANCCYRLATLYRWWPGKARLEEAMDFYRKETELWEEVLKEERSLLSEKNAAEAYCNLGWVIRAAKDEDDKGAASRIASAYERGAELWQIVSRSQPDDRKNYADACEQAGRAYREMEGHGNLVKAHVFCRNALAVQKERVQQEDTIEAHGAYIGAILAIMRVDASYTEDLYDEAVTEIRYLLKKTGDDSYRQMLKSFRQLRPWAKFLHFFWKHG